LQLTESEVILYTVAEGKAADYDKIKEMSFATVLKLYCIVKTKQLNESYRVLAQLQKMAKERRKNGK